MIVEDISELKKRKFPVIIIGSGPAGISTALKLEEHKINCLIIESGHLGDYEGSEKFLTGETFGDEYSELSKVRIKKFGGTSSLWGGYCNKFEKNEFESWPINFDELHNYDPQAKKILDLKFYHTDFYKKNFSENFNQFNIRFSPVKFKDFYLKKITKSKYISLSLNTTLIKFSGNINKISEILCEKSNNFFNLKAKFFILAAGGIENSRLLLWSKEENPSLFDKRLPIGKYYMDHPWHMPAEGFLSYSNLINHFEKNNFSRELYIDCLPRLYLSMKDSIKNKNDLLGTGIYLRIKNPEHLKDNLLKKALCIAPNFIKNKININKKSDLYEFRLNLHQEQEPEINNKISLSQKRDPFGIPLVKINWKMSSKLKKTATKNLIEFGNFLISEDIGRISIKDEVFYEKNFKVQNGAHQMGGTRSGQDFTKSVVDKDLKVHFSKNLFISGSSVFTTSGSCHPTYTIVLLSLRLGDHIKKII